MSIFRPLPRLGVSPIPFVSLDYPVNKADEASTLAARADAGWDDRLHLRVAEASFVALAELHAAFWMMDADYVSRFPWARGSDWLLGRNRPKREAFVAEMKSHYDGFVGKRAAGSLHAPVSDGWFSGLYIYA